MINRLNPIRLDPRLEFLLTWIARDLKYLTDSDEIHSIVLTVMTGASVSEIVTGEPLEFSHLHEYSNLNFLFL